jgi:hypothetical protein
LSAFDDGVHVKPLADLADVDVLSFELEGGGPRANLQPRDARQDVGQLIGQSVAEELFALSRASRHERQHGDPQDPPDPRLRR